MVDLHHHPCSHILRCADRLAPDRDDVIGRGVARTARDATASVKVHWLNRFAKPEEIALPASSRAQVISVVADPKRAGTLYAGTFVSKYEVAILRAARDSAGNWSTATVARKRMAWGLAAGDFAGDAQTEVACARLYGDSKEEPGDVQLLGIGGEGAALRVPSVRGARAILATPGPGGRSELLYSDGWHRQYKKSGLALLTRARRSGKA